MASMLSPFEAIENSFVGQIIKIIKKLKILYTGSVSRDIPGP